MGIPQKFRGRTVEDNGDFVQYRRRNTGRQREGRGRMCDNRWVVPYNPVLSLRLGYHVNVLICSCPAAAKNLFIYVFKGADHATIRQEVAIDGEEPAVTSARVGQGPNDEITRYLSARYISAPEAAWRASQFPTHHVEPPVVWLQVHLHILIHCAA